MSIEDAVTICFQLFRFEVIGELESALKKEAVKASKEFPTIPI